uniref:EARP complex and GARP complex interacting protein 1 n=1 Tax=Gadus morhua TaxID=8049 RepID=A0A8C5B897_GADMO
MEDDAPVIYGLEFQARALTAQTAETDAIRFLVGTQSLKFDNQIHIIDFDDENNIINKNVLLHQAGEIWNIGASPADKAVLTTCYNKMKTSRSHSPEELCSDDFRVRSSSRHLEEHSNSLNGRFVCSSLRYGDESTQHTQRAFVLAETMSRKPAAALVRHEMHRWGG